MHYTRFNKCKQLSSWLKIVLVLIEFVIPNKVLKLKSIYSLILLVL